MVKNCVAKWDAHQFSAPIRLWLRNRVFYSIMELPRVNGKRRYHRISLHTTNYYEAQEKAKIMAESISRKDYEAKAYVVAAKIIMRKMVFDKYTEPDGTEIIRISSKTDPTVLKGALEIVSKELDRALIHDFNIELNSFLNKQTAFYIINIYWKMLTRLFMPKNNLFLYTIF